MPIQMQLSHKGTQVLNANGAELYRHISVAETVAAGFAKFHVGGFLPAHTHNCWELLTHGGHGDAYLMLADQWWWFPPGSYAYIPPGVVHATSCGHYSRTSIRWLFPTDLAHVQRNAVPGGLGNAPITVTEQAAALRYSNQDAPCEARIFYPQNGLPVREHGVKVNMTEYVNVEGIVSAGDIAYQPGQGIAEHTHNAWEVIYIRGSAQYVRACGKRWCVRNGFVYLNTPHEWQCGTTAPSTMFWYYGTDRKAAGRNFTSGTDFVHIDAEGESAANFADNHEE